MAAASEAKDAATARLQQKKPFSHGRMLCLHRRMRPRRVLGAAGSPQRGSLHAVGGREDLKHICARMRSDDPEVLATACRAVAAIAADPEVCRAMSASGAIRDILAAIQLHSADHDLLQHACAALGAMAAHCHGAQDILDAGG